MNHAFLSYRHQSDDHAKAVLTLGEMLKAADLPVELDQFYMDAHPGGPDETWPNWCEDRAEKSACVLIVCSTGWFDSYRKKGQRSKGLGAALEAAVFSQQIYDDKGHSARVRLVILDDFNEDGIPPRLKGWHIFRPFNGAAEFDQMTKWIRQRLAAQQREGEHLQVERLEKEPLEAEQLEKELGHWRKMCLEAKRSQKKEQQLLGIQRREMDSLDFVFTGSNASVRRTQV